MRTDSVELQNAIHLRVGGYASHRPIVGEVPANTQPPVLNRTREEHIPQQSAALNSKVSRDRESLLCSTAAATNTGVGIGLDGDAVHIGMRAIIVEGYEVVCARGPAEGSDDHICTVCWNGASVPGSAIAPEECPRRIDHRAPHVRVAALSERSECVILGCRIILADGGGV